MQPTYDELFSQNQALLTEIQALKAEVKGICSRGEGARFFGRKTAQKKPCPFTPWTDTFDFGFQCLNFG